MTKKTYGVSGYIEWVANISAGGVTLQVPFTGGAITKYGVVPAEYTTADPVIQHIIENSALFRSGRIRRLREEEPQKKKSPVAIKVARLADAAEVLREKCGVPASRITSTEEAKRIALEHNIILDGI